jgi:hypothetical protein
LLWALMMLIMICNPNANEQGHLWLFPFAGVSFAIGRVLRLVLR